MRQRSSNEGLGRIPNWGASPREQLLPCRSCLKSPSAPKAAGQPAASCRAAICPFASGCFSGNVGQPPPDVTMKRAGKTDDGKRKRPRARKALSPGRASSSLPRFLLHPLQVRSATSEASAHGADEPWGFCWLLTAIWAVSFLRQHVLFEDQHRSPKQPGARYGGGARCPGWLCAALAFLRSSSRKVRVRRVTRAPS